MNYRLFLTSMLLSCSIFANENAKFYFDKISYEEYIYSASKKTEVGDSVELDINTRYKISDSSSFSFGFQTYPEDNRFNNKTSKFEIVASHAYEGFEFSLDGELQTDESDKGGTALGVDLDSHKTFISYNFPYKSNLTFYPFNFDGEVGSEFNTWDITRINYIEGTPSSVTANPGDDDKVATKTIPGLVLTTNLTNSLKVYYGIGKATYIYPANANFDVKSSPTVDRWERREVTANKFGITYKNDEATFLDLKVITQNNTKQTGSLIESAASLESKFNASSYWYLESEIVYTKAGAAPWKINKETGWFANKAPFDPIYADSSSQKLDFIGKSDFAFALKLAFKNESTSPYIFYRFQGEHFIFRERESAHLLRTADDSKSHGGLDRLGFGMFIVKGNFLITPEIEYLKAKNPVFSSSSDVRDDRLLSEFKKTDYLLQIKVTYDYDGAKPFSL